MWLDRFSGHHSTQATPAPSPPPNRHLSPAPRRSAQLGPSTLPRRPGISPRTSSLSVSSFGASSDNLPTAARISNGSNLKNELAGAPAAEVADPLEVLQRILGPWDEKLGAATNGVLLQDEQPESLSEDIPFEGLSLKQFAEASPKAANTDTQSKISIPIIEDFEKEKDKFEDLHKSILACDAVLKSVESYLTSFRADLAAVSSEIEHLQDRSTALNNKLQNRKAVDKILGPEVEVLSIPPAVVRKLTEGQVDEAWVKALDDLEKRSKAIYSKMQDGKAIKAMQDVRPFIDDVSAKVVERIRDYVVAQIKALRSPSIDAQVIQQNNFLRYRNIFGFLAARQSQLAEEISQAYINTMRWYYSSHFTRYKAALDKLNIYITDQMDAIGSESAAKKAKPGVAHDIFSIGRRADCIRTTNDAALPSFAAEEDKGTHFLETPFRAFNLALVDNASAEYGFLTEYFSKQSFQTTNRKFTEIFTSTFQLGQELTKQLIETSLDTLGILICVRLTQHFAFELQRRKVPAMEGYINATNMLLWPRFQQIMDVHCESLRKSTTSLPGKPAGSALSLTASPAAAQTTAPHPLTQRFANFVQGILSLSSEAGDDEPVSHSVGRLRSDFEAFLLKLSRGIADVRKRERFLYNNYSLVCTILGDVEGKLAEEVVGRFEELKEGSDRDV